MAASRVVHERGLTLLEVVIALLLFAMMSTFMLSGQSRAAEIVHNTRIEREAAEALTFRLQLIALQHEDYEDGEEGPFPFDGSTRLVDEAEVLGDRFTGWRWRVEMREVIGAGADTSSEVGDGGEALELLFPEDGQGSTESEDDPDAADVDPGVAEDDDVDRMMFIRVTVFPPGHENIPPEAEKESPLRPRSAWTAIHLPPEDTEDGP